MRLLSLTMMILSIAIFSCQSNPAKKADKKADDLADMAQSEANVADAQMEASVDNASAAIVHATQAELNKAIAGVEVPTFKGNMTANELVKKIGNEAVDFINANNYDKAQDFANKLNGHIQSIATLQSDGKLNAEEAEGIKQYCRNVGAALKMQLN